MPEQFDELLHRVYEIQDLNAAASILSWDQSTYMPPGGAQARAEQLATLQRLAHERLVADEMGRLLEDLEPYEKSLPYDSVEAALVRVTRREYERWHAVPPAFTARLAALGAQTHQTWVQARPTSDFAAVAPWLERLLDASRELAGYLPGPRAHIADPLVALADYGMGAAEVRDIFARLRTELVPLVEAVTAAPPADDACLHLHYPAREQLAFARRVIERLGYDFERGHMDLSAHPFTMRFACGDVRVTTRVREDNLAECLFGTIHEAGHALYEQGVDPALDRTYLGSGASSGLHESQSRLWENLVGRGLPFWRYFYPQLQAQFPAQLGAVPLERFYRAINKVERSLIRVEADEVTYNLHVMLRLDFELQLLEGTLSIRDLPEAWRTRFESDFGIVPPNDSDGVLQDVHWYSAFIGGMFQGYTLGNVMSALFYNEALKAHPEIPNEMKQGKFDTLHNWLIQNIYRHGRKYTAPELVQKVTGRDLTIQPYINYLKIKYGELYTL